MDLFFTSVSIKRFIYLAILFSVAFFIEYHIGQPQSYWLVYTVIALSLTLSGDTFAKRMVMVSFTGLAMACVSFLAVICAFVFPLLAIYLFILTVICTFLGERYRHWIYPLFIINLFAILSAFTPALMSEAAARFFYSVAGAGLVLTFEIPFSIYSLRDNQTFYTVLALQHLKSLVSEIFISLQPDYTENTYLFENRIHQQEFKFLKTLTKLRRLNYLSNTSSIVLLDKLDQLYDIIMNCAQLRWRVTDRTLFSVCEQELNNISQEVNKFFACIIKNQPTHLSSNMGMLSERIAQFEEIYQNVLRVTSREPLALFLFIFGLKALNESLARFNRSQENS